MPTYKTPDVHVEEISTFPPSVAEVETAIPAFIGYTQKAKDISEDDLLMEPQEISSMVDFNRYFGGGPPLVEDYNDPNDRVKVKLNDSNAPVDADFDDKYYLFDSLRLFYENGGGKCYVISVGRYGESVSLGDSTSGLKGGLKKLEKLDEPTIICFPDAVLLPDKKLYNLQKAALAQCNELMDRVLLCDLKNSGDHDSDVDEFRGNIGINNLKYGAAYTPWLKTQLPKEINFRDLKLERESGGDVAWKSLTKDNDLRDLITLLQKAVDETESIKSDIIDANSDTEESIKAHFQKETDDYESNVDSFTSTGDYRNKLREIYEIIVDVSDTLFDYGTNISDEGRWKLKTDFDAMIEDNSLDEEMQKLLHHSNAFDSSAPILTSTTFSNKIDNINFYSSNGVTNSGDGGPIDSKYGSAADDEEKGEYALKAAKSVFSVFNTVVNELLNSARKYEETLDDSLVEAFGLYKSILEKVNDTLSVTPPSGAIAGIYAYVDRNRGVHKAPANVSLSGISGFTETIDSREQRDLNVDANAGKSINALRTFTGKGHLVWGARTLAGNDNEWRYVPVRRFFNMVEESVKKSTYWAVFEPNDANTWVKVQTMIENYLTQKWREGALAGAKPEQAFYVNVGLGLTMTQQDILEGRMNVEIGMAVVRPAEFIILKFSHKMQEA